MKSITTASPSQAPVFTLGFGESLPLTLIVFFFVVFFNPELGIPFSAID